MDSSPAPHRLRAEGLSMTFGRVRALASVSLTVAAGEIHGLVGHNGSGKSTLVKVLAGVHAPDPGGAVSLDGEPLRLPARGADLAARGVAFVHQDLGLIDSLSVTENCRVGRFAAGPVTRRIRWGAEHERVRGHLARLGSDLDPRAPVGGLSAADRATVAIARAMADQLAGRGIIILDEATRSLPRPAQERLYHLIRAFAAGGGSVLLITHRVDEVLSLAGRVTVLRDGEVAAAGIETSGLDHAALGQILAGRREDPSRSATTPRSGGPARPASTNQAGRTNQPRRPPRPAPGADGQGPDQIRARISGLRGRTVAAATFSVAAGEVVGLTGLLGSGFDELPRLLAGAERAAAGQLEIAGTVIDLSRSALRRCLDAGVVLVPERRDTEGLALSLSVRENLALPMIRRKSRPWLIRAGWEDDLVRRSVADLGITPAAGGTPAGWLSGGNRQKVLFGKWLATGPRLLVLHEPTQGVDVGARAQLLSLIRGVAADGLAVIMASIEAEDLAAVCDRVLITRDGRIAAELTAPCADAEIIRLTYQDSPGPATPAGDAHAEAAL